jgi:hypothetical protein
MSEYRIRSTGEVKNQGQIRRDNPNVSLPRVWNDNVNETLGIDPVLASPKPDPSGDYKVVVRNGVEQDANGNWVWAWTENDMFSEYTEEVTDENDVTTTNVVTVQAQIDAYEANKLATKREGLVVTMRQARLALAQEDKLQLVEDAIALIPEPDRTTISIEWEYASTVERVSPWIDTMASALGMTDVEMDALFELAATL